MKLGLLPMFVGALLLHNGCFAQGIAASMDEGDPVTASMVVIGTAYAIERIEAYCQSTHPDTGATITAAKEAWLARHESVYEKAGAIIVAEVSQQDRNRLFAEMRSENDRIVGMLESASQQESLGWCTAAPGRFEQPEMNMRGRTQLLSTIRNYAI